MAVYKHVLLAADLIGRDDHPVSKRASQLAVETKAKFSIIHVMEQPFYYGIPYETPTLSTWLQQVEEDVKHNFSTLAEELGIPKKNRHLVKGQAKKMILETASKIGADLIIVGSHARHGIDLVLMGSTANAVLHSATCDVLAVRVSDEAARKKK